MSCILDFPFKNIPPIPVEIPWESNPPNVAPKNNLECHHAPFVQIIRSRHIGCPLPMLRQQHSMWAGNLFTWNRLSVIRIGWESKYGDPLMGGTVDGRNPAPVEVGSLSHYLDTRFYTSQVVVWDFFHQYSILQLQHWKHRYKKALTGWIWLVEFNNGTCVLKVDDE